MLKSWFWISWVDITEKSSTLILDFSASRSVRKYMSVAKATQSTVFCHGSLSRLFLPIVSVAHRLTHTSLSPLSPKHSWTRDFVPDQPDWGEVEKKLHFPSILLWLRHCHNNCSSSHSVSSCVMCTIEIHTQKLSSVVLQLLNRSSSKSFEQRTFNAGDLLARCP